MEKYVNFCNTQYIVCLHLLIAGLWLFLYNIPDMPRLPNVLYCTVLSTVNENFIRNDNSYSFFLLYFMFVCVFCRCNIEKNLYQGVAGYYKVQFAFIFVFKSPKQFNGPFANWKKQIYS